MNIMINSERAKLGCFLLVIRSCLILLLLQLLVPFVSFTCAARQHLSSNSQIQAPIGCFDFFINFFELGFGCDGIFLINFLLPKIRPSFITTSSVQIIQRKVTEAILRIRSGIAQSCKLVIWAVKIWRVSFSKKSQCLVYRGLVYWCTRKRSPVTKLKKIRLLSGKGVSRGDNAFQNIKTSTVRKSIFIN